MIIIIPAIIFALLLGFITYSKPFYFAKKDNTGKKVIQWKRTIILTIILTVVLSGLLFFVAPELLMM